MADRYLRTRVFSLCQRLRNVSGCSEYPVVVIPVLTQHYAMLQRNLLYTGVTRGKRLVILLGQKKAIAMAVKNTSGRNAGQTAGVARAMNGWRHSSLFSSPFMLA